MASYVEIANFALDLVGQSQIMSLDDPTSAARKAKLHIYEAVREVLRSGKWKSARNRVALNLITAVPLFGWSKQYQLPGDYIRMVMFNDLDPLDVREPTFVIEGRVLLTDESVANLIYVRDLTANGNDINAVPPDLTELFVLQLAIKLSWVFQQARTLRDGLLQEYAMKRKIAMMTDAQENKDPLVNRLHDSVWLQERNVSTNG